MSKSHEFVMFLKIEAVQKKANTKLRTNRLLMKSIHTKERAQRENLVNSIKKMVNHLQKHTVTQGCQVE